MSLINDALQRAKKAQETNPPPPGGHLQLRPVEDANRPPTDAKLTFGLVISVVLILIAVAVLALGEMRQTIRAKAAVQKDTTSTAASSPFASPKTIATTTRLAAGAAAAQATNAVPVVLAASAAKLAPLKLQAIFFNPVQPSAIISGKTVFAGSRLGEFRVVNIRQSAVTLASQNQTNVLKIE